MLQFLFQKGKMGNGINRAGADHNIRPLLQYGLHQRLNIITAVLVIRVRVDYNIRALSERFIQTRHKAAGKSPVFSKIDHMVDAPCPCHFHRPVSASVINDQILDLINAVNLSRKRVQRNLQSLLFIVAWYLNY